LRDGLPAGWGRSTPVEERDPERAEGARLDDARSNFVGRWGAARALGRTLKTEIDRQTAPGLA
jgi:hypothetical protein